MAVTTTGWHRVSNVTSLASGGITTQAVPFAQIYVTSTSTGEVATIYSDAGLSIPISGSIIVADETGSYDYYIPLNYCVTETISYPSGSSTVVVNISQNGPVAGSLTTTASTSDAVSITGITPSSHISLQPTNLAAATMYASTYVSGKSSGTVTISHPATSGATFDVIATTY